ncbi:restriction endonuclease subunit S [Gudongella sp. SC589]|uniref:restriction endonuclease subunit S n=1 Tax=Gudongella sp. SC589 TaxID=3385990 RepID=UPI003904A87E
MSFSEWKEVELEEVIELVIDYRGKTPKKLGGDWSRKGYKALSAKNIKTGVIVQEDTIRYLDTNLYKKWMKEEVNRGDILMTSEAPFGELLLWDSDEKIVLSQRLFCLRTNYKVYSKYLYYYMTTNRFQKELDARATGTTVRGLRQPQLLKCKIEYPPLQEQKAIAHILSTLDEKIEINNKINKTLEEMAQAIFKHWFVDFEFPNEDGEPYKSSGGEMVHSELGPIPKGWEVGNISDLGDIVGGGTPSRKKEEYFVPKGIPWITPKDLSNNKNKYIYEGENDISELGLKNSSAKIVPQGTVLFSSRAPIGYIAIAAVDVTTNQGFKSIVPKETYGSEYVYQELKNKTALISSRASGSTFKEISGSGLKSIETVIPSEQLVNKFSSVVGPFSDRIKANEQEIDVLTNFRDTLLPKLMSGEIRVPLEEDE